MITAFWDGTMPMTEEYVLLRALFSAAREESIRKSGVPFYGLSACRTEDRYVMTEYEGKDGTKILAVSSGDRLENGTLRNQRFVFEVAS